MNEQQRVRMLLGVLGVSVAFVILNPLIDSILFKPIRDREQRLNRLNVQIVDEEDRELELFRARSLLGDATARSLPSDPLNAQRLYQQWLHDLAQQAGLTRLEVLPGIHPERKTRDGTVFHAVQVAIDGEATLSELSTFLYRFQRADLMHRIYRMKITSDESEGNPVMVVSLTAEGVAMADATDRTDLFPRTTTDGALDDKATSITVADASSFPEKPGFLLRSGKEHLTVTAIQGNQLSVERAADGTKAESHEVGANVELVPIHPDRTGFSLDQYKELIASSPFVKPRPPVTYRPRLASISTKTLTRGTPLKFKARASGLDPQFGRASYQLNGETQDGMSIDPSTGDFVWEATAEQPVGEYEVEIAVVQSRNSELALSSKVKIRLREPNETPTITLEEEFVAFLGQEIAIQVAAEDDGPAESLTYSLAEGAPEGAAIDAKTGKFTWTPATSQEPAQHEVSITVTDQGDPPLKATKKITIDAQDDAASFTYLIAAVAADDVWEAWLFDRSKNQRTVVHEGSNINVSNIEAVVAEVGKRHLLVDSDGGRWRLNLGQNLRSMVQLDGPKKDTAEDDKPESDGKETPATDRPPYEPPMDAAEGDKAEPTSDESPEEPAAEDPPAEEPSTEPAATDESNADSEPAASDAEDAPSPAPSPDTSADDE